MDFVPSLPTLIAFTIAILLLAVTPGPDMTLWISRSLREGRAAGFMTLVGTNIGITVHRQADFPRHLVNHRRTADRHRHRDRRRCSLRLAATQPENSARTGLYDRRRLFAFRREDFLHAGALTANKKAPYGAFFTINRSATHRHRASGRVSCGTCRSGPRPRDPCGYRRRRRARSHRHAA